MTGIESVELSFEETWPRVTCRSGTFRVDGADHAVRDGTGMVFHRLPRAALDRVRQPFMRAVEAQPAGVRLCFDTEAQEIRLLMRAVALTFFPDEAPEYFGVVDLLVNGALVASRSISEVGVHYVEFAGGREEFTPGPNVEIVFDDLGRAPKSIEIWLPHDVEVTVISVASSAPIAIGPAYARRRWIHHGSSISHGMNAVHPSQTWPATAARTAGVNLTNLGVAGNAVLDPHVARAIRDTPGDIVSVKVGINILDYDGFRARTFVPALDGFLDTIREKHQTTPLWVVSPILSPAVEDRPGPVVLREHNGIRISSTDSIPADLVRGRLSAQAIRALIQDIVTARSPEDPNLYYLDGRALYGDGDDVVDPLPDGSHPSSASHEIMGERFADLVLNR